MELNIYTRSASRVLKKTIAPVLSLLLLFVAGCSSEPIELGAPKVTFYVLDLTGSGDVDSQFKRIETELNRSISQGPFGNPFADESERFGPETAYFSFIGTNSRFLESFQLVDLSSVYSLFEKVSLDNRRKENWSKLRDAYQEYVKRNSNSGGQSPTQSDCAAYYDRALSSLFNSQTTRDDYSQRLCEMALSNISVLGKVKEYISSQKKNQEASDVFGALQILEREVKQVLNDFPEAKVSVVLATDGDHTYGKNQADNLKLRIQESQDVCALAEDVAGELQVETLRSDAIDLKAEGLGALKNSVGRYPAQLDSFWRCFFDEQ
jgi:hypothetical protein